MFLNAARHSKTFASPDSHATTYAHYSPLRLHPSQKIRDSVQVSFLDLQLWSFFLNKQKRCIVGSALIDCTLFVGIDEPYVFHPWNINKTQPRKSSAWLPFSSFSTLSLIHRIGIPPRVWFKREKIRRNNWNIFSTLVFFPFLFLQLVLCQTSIMRRRKQCHRSVTDLSFITHGL
jgi:hypothetical protein